MDSTHNNRNEARKLVNEALFAIGKWISVQLFTYGIAPIAGSALSILFTSTFALIKLRRAMRLREKQSFLEYVENEIITLEDEIRKLEEKISLVKDAYQTIKEEHRKISFEEELRTLLNQLRELVNIKLYFESIRRSLQVIEPLRHLYGDKIDEIYFKVIDLADKAVEGRVKDKELRDLIDKISYYLDSIPDFPQILLEVAEENLR